MKHGFWLAAVSALALAACASTGPKDPAQAVYVAKTSFLGALEVADAYAELPRCPAAALCSDPAIIRTSYKAALNAKVALDAAEAVVRAGDLGKVDGALSAAQTAVQALIVITQSMKVPQ